MCQYVSYNKSSVIQDLWYNCETTMHFQEVAITICGKKDVSNNDKIILNKIYHTQVYFRNS